MKRILICGDRNWKDRSFIDIFIRNLPKDTVIIHGNCRGADQIAGSIAKKYGLEVISFPADWRKYGRKAGPIRNRQMIREGKPDLVVAFHNDLSKSKGTLNMILQANRSGIPILLLSNKLRGGDP